MQGAIHIWKGHRAKVFWVFPVNLGRRHGVEGNFGRRRWVGFEDFVGFPLRLIFLFYGYEIVSVFGLIMILSIWLRNVFERQTYVFELESIR